MSCGPRVMILAKNDAMPVVEKFGVAGSRV